MIFILSLQDLQGDNKVVNIIEDWDVLAEYAGEKLGFYQILAVDGTIEIRVQTGRIGYKKEFENGNDPLLNKILERARLDWNRQETCNPQIKLSNLVFSIYDY
jgi:serine phosphatase RsbU (regulator of sigma subunit)